ncbi:glycosyl hydrolase family 17 [Bythopirellula polymerisocia]|uniref:Endo-1,3-beta-glucanase btgC n=1 Tax=Bythopirellula polymerisocia TaxID=2528003 RepID=A0A5C6D3K8_9BACT|nr:glycosyl hydrolase family 17 [Bythopirellula polymerisocia]TWU29816.1 Glycosyl hydrolases family 17 [Bythopirellula polymerisocia]
MFPTRSSFILLSFLLLLSVLINSEHTSAEANNSGQDSEGTSKDTLEEREFSPTLDGKWIGQGISYGPYREEESPDGLQPTREELIEDLAMLAQHWNLLRMYGAGEAAEEVLKIIHEKKLPLKVMIGAWIVPEVEAANPLLAEVSNKREVAEAIRLANAYPDEVIAVSIGNETQVFWSDHKTSPEVLIRYLREVRSATSVPVTTADDFNFWNKPESKQIADEVDFIVTHIHAMWAGLQLPQAMEWTEKVYDEVKENYPQKMVVIGEAGWATQVHDEGEQAKLIKGKAGEAEQREYYRQFTDWARDQKICTFYFEAFDEPWKGGPHPNEVEKHWGLYGVDREPKKAMTGTGK